MGQEYVDTSVARALSSQSRERRDVIRRIYQDVWKGVREVSFRFGSGGHDDVEEFLDMADGYANLVRRAANGETSALGALTKLRKVKKDSAPNRDLSHLFQDVTSNVKCILDMPRPLDRDFWSHIRV
jgi:hypothetical protein